MRSFEAHWTAGDTMDAWRRVAEPVSTVACPEPPFSGDHSTMVAMCRALESQM
ncbi:hypothetical protein ASPBRDRAFT_46223, partial [Aspergillus brasiliensis CBS 101740]